MPVSHHQQSAGTRVQETGTPLLRLEFDGQRRDPVLLTPGKWTLGSDGSNRIVFPGANIAPRQWLILVTPHRAVIRDWTGDSLLNGRPLHDAVLTEGDTLSMNGLQLSFRNAASTEIGQATETGQATEIGQAAASEEQRSTGRQDMPVTLESFVESLELIDESVDALSEELCGREESPHRLDVLSRQIEEEIVSRGRRYPAEQPVEHPVNSETDDDRDDGGSYLSEPLEPLTETRDGEPATRGMNGGEIGMSMSGDEIETSASSESVHASELNQNSSRCSVLELNDDRDRLQTAHTAASVITDDIQSASDKSQQSNIEADSAAISAETDALVIAAEREKLRHYVEEFDTIPAVESESSENAKGNDSAFRDDSRDVWQPPGRKHEGDACFGGRSREEARRQLDEMVRAAGEITEESARENEPVSPEQSEETGPADEPQSPALHLSLHRGPEQDDLGPDGSEYDGPEQLRPDQHGPEREKCGDFLATEFDQQHGEQQAVQNAATETDATHHPNDRLDDGDPLDSREPYGHSTSNEHLTERIDQRGVREDSPVSDDSRVSDDGGMRDDGGVREDSRVREDGARSDESDRAGTATAGPVTSGASWFDSNLSSLEQCEPSPEPFESQVTPAAAASDPVASDPVAPDQDASDQDASGSETTVGIPPQTFSRESETLTRSTGSDAAHHEPPADDSASILRSQLAEMFDLPQLAGETTTASSHTPSVSSDHAEDERRIASDQRASEPRTARDSAESPDSAQASGVPVSGFAEDRSPRSDKHRSDEQDATHEIFQDNRIRPLLSGDAPVTGTDADVADAATENHTSADPDTSDSSASPASQDRDASDEDMSISDYMERLLARNRRQLEGEAEPDEAEHDGSGFASEPASLTSSARRDPETAETASTADGSGSSPSQRPSQSPSNDQVWFDQKPRHHQNRDQVRAEVQVLREVANHSARTAVAVANRKQFRRHICVKTTASVLALGSGVAALLLQVSTIFGIVVMGIGLIFAADLGLTIFRDWQRLRQLRRDEKAAMRAKSGLTVDGFRISEPVREVPDKAN